MTDLFCRGVLGNERLAVGVATTTSLCQKAQQIQDLGATSAIALGRLMTATVLTGLIANRAGSQSLQVVSGGRFKQIFADITDDGAVRGYVRPPNLAMPPLSEASRLGRRSISHAVGDGALSVIRVAPDEAFTQSSTNLVSGEIDADVAHFLAASDQIPSAVATDVLLGDEDEVSLAAGVIVQAMPGAPIEGLDELRALVENGALAERLSTHSGDSASLLSALFPEAKVTDAAVPIFWSCRCSTERVQGALRMLDALDLAEILEAGEKIKVTCDFCGQIYQVEPEAIRTIYESMVQVRGQ